MNKKGWYNEYPEQLIDGYDVRDVAQGKQRYENAD